MANKVGIRLMSEKFKLLPVFNQKLTWKTLQLIFFFFFFHFCGQNGFQDKITYYVTDDIFWNFVMNPWKE